jgi:hypothetical protein
MNFCTNCGAPRADLVQPCSRCGVAPPAPSTVSLVKPAAEVTLPAPVRIAPPPVHPPVHPATMAAPPVARPPLPPPPAPLGPPRPAGSSRRRSLLLVLVAAVLAVAVGVTTAVLLAGRDEPGTGDDRAADADRSDGPASTGSADGADDGSGEDAEAAYTCWDGTTAADRAGCGQPAGVAGLHWVFPDSDGPRCSTTSGNRGAEADCRVRASSGGEVRVHYSEWSDWDAAHAEYSAQDVQGAVTRWRDFFRWYITPRRGDWEHKVALLYRDAPWSVTVYGHTAADRDEVLHSLAARPVSDLMGERKK